MKVLITGAGGMLGRKLTHKLQQEGVCAGQTIESISLHDIAQVEDSVAGNIPLDSCGGDLADRHTVDQLMQPRPDVIFHLAAIVSGEAELDFDRGYQVNLVGTQNLLAAIRQLQYVPRLVFASSVAVFGAPLPNEIPDTFHTTPQTSYGTQKAIAELLISDHSRRGLVDGISLRLPTICVRPGKPNAAASGFFSNIIREPLNGEPAVLPVSTDVLHWHASPRSAVNFFLHAAQLPSEDLGTHRALTMPGVAVTVEQQIEALRSIAGDAVVELIEKRPDPFVQNIVKAWPRSFDARRAADLGFVAERDFGQIIQNHIDDELGGSIPSH